MKRLREKQKKAIDFISLKLLKRGFAVFTNPQDDRYHILCTNIANGKKVKIRVTTSKRSMKKWTLNEADDYHSDNLFYVFVGDKSLGNQEFFVIPSKIVSDKIIKNADLWIGSKRKDGEPHRDKHMREFKMDDSEIKKYLNRWDFLGLD